MNSNMVKPEKCGHLHLVYRFTVPLIAIYVQKSKHLQTALASASKTVLQD